MDTLRLLELTQAYLTDTISTSEGAELVVLLKQPEYQEAFMKIIYEQLQRQELDMDVPSPVIFERIQRRIEQQIRQESDRRVSLGETTPVHRIPFLRRWSWAAAAVFLLLCAGTYLWKYEGRHISGLENIYHHSVTYIPPGRQGAILTLADGKRVVLDSLGNGVVATQNGMQVILRNGELTYDRSEKSNGGIAYNTMSTPKGRQFQVKLPDGTQVWLNAASSIKYPTIFAGKERQVEITGEAYFEVAKNAGKPFKVAININNDLTVVEVLGTHFNINAYKDEAAIRTTLLEGSVKMIHGTDKVQLQPGQQAQLRNTEKILVKNADIEKVVAWKNGFFNFEGTGIEEVMRQLSRWYDIDVVYAKGVPDVEFVGKLSKNVPLPDLLNGLEGFGIHFRIEERHKLVVLP